MCVKLKKKVQKTLRKFKKGVFRILKTIKKMYKKIVQFIKNIFLYLTPIFSLYVSFNFAKLYFEKETSKIENVVHIGLLLLQIGFILFYCYELRDINKKTYTSKKRAELFIFIFLHIIQLFTNIYLLLLTINADSLTNITAKTPWQLCFDITYFSTMSFIGGDAVYYPATRIAKSMVLIESLIFIVYISIIVFNIFTKEEQEKID